VYNYLRIYAANNLCRNTWGFHWGESCNQIQGCTLLRAEDRTIYTYRQVKKLQITNYRGLCHGQLNENRRVNMWQRSANSEELAEYRLQTHVLRIHTLLTPCTYGRTERKYIKRKITSQVSYIKTNNFLPLFIDPNGQTCHAMYSGLVTHTTPPPHTGEPGHIQPQVCSILLSTPALLFTQWPTLEHEAWSFFIHITSPLPPSISTHSEPSSKPRPASST
jgi:hypothetical protein